MHNIYSEYYVLNVKHISVEWNLYVAMTMLHKIDKYYLPFTKILHMILIDFLIWGFFRPQNVNSDHVPAFYTQEDRGTS